MAVLWKSTRFSRNFLNKIILIRENKSIRSFRTIVQEPKPTRGIIKTSIIGAVVGTTIGIGYAYWKIERDRKNLSLEGSEINVDILKYKPPIEPSRRIVSPVDPTGLKLTLFQYQSCPFCCKVRTFLDYYGISYDVVEVDPVLRREISWSSYRKVPILLAKVDGGYRPLNDSSMIVSVLASHLNDKSYNLNDLAKYYPVIAMNDDDGKFKHEIINKYFLMYQGEIPKDRTLDEILEERKWRKWADDVLVHTLSPNVYRTLGEAYETFQWFSDVGKWEEYFPTWERKLMINVGAWAMWMIGKRLQKRHHLKTDVRESFYDELNHWLKGIEARGSSFMGGSNPDLSDLAVYGVLRSIEGCQAFKDALEHTKLSGWYQAMTERVNNHGGASMLAG
ncbi:prostaglandin E synthase 2 [Microplitis demolitor]|uniref:prostaglandin E synthase 2 n=1 Tax=Microplitis demolitor TaxID=69319 RepID=UPI0004CD1C1D|nr:prostaglandin E synthase 2 [Microplitis demolitor]